MVKGIGSHLKRIQRKRPQPMLARVVAIGDLGKGIVCDLFKQMLMLQARGSIQYGRQVKNWSYCKD